VTCQPCAASCMQPPWQISYWIYLPGTSMYEYAVPVRRTAVAAALLRNEDGGYTYTLLGTSWHSAQLVNSLVKLKS
jgi:hypothetical protein